MFMCDELFWSIFTEKGETPFSMDVLTPKYREIWIEKYVGLKKLQKPKA